MNDEQGTNASLLKAIEEIQKSPKVAPIYKKAENYGINTAYICLGDMVETPDQYVNRLKKAIAKYESKHKH